MRGKRTIGLTLKAWRKLRESLKHTTTYETSTDEGATWRETDHPYALAKRILELEPA